MKALSNIALWIKALRAPFFQAVIIPAVLGTAIAWYRTGHFHLGYFLLTLFGVILINAGTNLTNDYYDHKTRNDEINTEFTQFNGGSRVIQDGLIPAKTILIVAIVCFCLAAVIGLYLTWARGWVILALGFFGVVTGFFYTAAPVKIGYRGLGEFIVGLNCGPLVLLGSYYVQAKTFSLEALIISLPIGLLITAILYINQFPDYECDKASKKQTLIVLLGPEKAKTGYYILLILSYLVICIGSLLQITPWITLISLITIPLAIKASSVLKNHYNGGRKLIPAMGSTIAMHLLIGLLLSGSYIVGRVLSI